MYSDSHVGNATSFCDWPYITSIILRSVIWDSVAYFEESLWLMVNVRFCCYRVYLITVSGVPLTAFSRNTSCVCIKVVTARDTLGVKLVKQWKQTASEITICMYTWTRNLQFWSRLKVYLNTSSLVYTILYIV